MTVRDVGLLWKDETDWRGVSPRSYFEWPQHERRRTGEGWVCDGW